MYTDFSSSTKKYIQTFFFDNGEEDLHIYIYIIILFYVFYVFTVNTNSSTSAKTKGK